MDVLWCAIFEILRFPLIKSHSLKTRSATARLAEIRSSMKLTFYKRKVNVLKCASAKRLIGIIGVCSFYRRKVHNFDDSRSANAPIEPPMFLALAHRRGLGGS